MDGILKLDHFVAFIYCILAFTNLHFLILSPILPDMAGVIAAIQNGVGIIGGAAKVAKLISTRALYDDKMGSFGTMITAIDGCVENGAKSKFPSLISSLWSHF